MPRSPTPSQLPAGFVERDELLHDAATRECVEEAGVAPQLLGILRVEHSVRGSGARLRVVYLAEPTDVSAPLKSVPDDESVGAAWRSLDDLECYKARRQLRGDELLVWARHMHDGGVALPLAAFCSRLSSF
jgi:ADP-ribose pyrophosphatase YjhB (NUDIX family)